MAPPSGILQIIIELGPKIAGLLGKIGGAVYDYGADFRIFGDKEEEEKKESQIVPREEQTETEKSTKEMGRLGVILDFLTSPTFGRILLLASAVTMLFSPLGPVIGAIGLSLTIASISYGVITDTMRLRNLRAVQEEKALLDEIKGLREGLERDIGSDPRLANLIGLVKDDDRTIPHHQASIAKSTARAFATSTPENASTLAISIATLNPLAIYFAIASSVLSYIGASSQRHEYAKQQAELFNHNEAAKAAIGVGFENGKGVEPLRSMLAATRNQYIALERVKHDLQQNPYLTAKEVEDKFCAYLEKYNERVKAPEKPSFLRDMGAVLTKGFSYQDSAKQYAPMASVFTEYYQTQPYQVPQSTPKGRSQPQQERYQNHEREPHFRERVHTQDKADRGSSLGK